MHYGLNRIIKNKDLNNMRQLKLVLFIALVCLTSCATKIKNDKSIGDAELNAYKLLANRLTEGLKQEFNGNMYQNDKITPIETDEGIKIGIPNGKSYIFKKDNSKYIKGDLNNDKLSDLIICADMNELRGPTTKKYFVFLQEKDGYQYFVEFKADDIVMDNCRKANLNFGVFNLDSISNGLLVGNTKYQGNHESFYQNFSYCCLTEKYKLNIASKTVEFVYQSDLLKKNDKTGVFEKAVKE